MAREVRLSCKSMPSGVGSMGSKVHPSGRPVRAAGDEDVRGK